MTGPARPEGGARRRRKLKVYTANWDGRNDVLLACHSMKEFLAATRVGRAYSHECCNEEDCAAALAAPRVVLMRPINARPEVPWSPVPVARLPTPTPPPDGGTADGGGPRSEETA